MIAFHDEPSVARGDPGVGDARSDASSPRRTSAWLSPSAHPRAADGVRGELQVVTGAFGFAGKYIARLLLAEGQTVKTLTAHPQRGMTHDPLGKYLPGVIEGPSARPTTSSGILHETSTGVVVNYLPVGA